MINGVGKSDLVSKIAIHKHICAIDDEDKIARRANVTHTDDLGKTSDIKITIGAEG